MLKIILFLFIITGCQEVKESKRSVSAPVPTGPIIINSFNLELHSTTPDVITLNQEAFDNFNIVYILTNLSTKSVDGIISPIDINTPSFNNISNSAGVDLVSTSIFTSALGALPNCATMTVIVAEESCAFRFLTNYSQPASENTILVNQIASLNISSITQSINKTISVILKKRVKESSKEMVLLMKSELDPELDVVDSEGYPKGLFLATASQATKSYETFAPCNFANDGSPSLEGVYPYISNNTKRPIATIGSKVFFTGRGCSYSGNRQMESYAVWMFDADLNISSTNPQRISKDFGSGAGFLNMNPKYLTIMGPLLFYVAPTTFQSSPVFNDNYSKESLFLFDTSLPLSVNNPREIDTGYIDLDSSLSASIGGDTSGASNLAIYDQKVYFHGKSYRDNAGLLDKQIGLLEYDPSLAESSTNPRRIFSYDVNALYSNIDGFSNIVVNDSIIAASIDLKSIPLDINSPDIGRELIILDRITGNVKSSFDICSGPCNSDIYHLQQIDNGDLLFTAKDISGERKVMRIDSSFNSLTSSFDYDVLDIKELNISGQDVSPNLWQFHVAKIGNAHYFKGYISTGVSTIYKIQNGLVNPVIPAANTAYLGTADSFSKLYSAGSHLAFDHQYMSGANTYTTINLLDPSSNVSSSLNPRNINVNHKAKYLGYGHDIYYNMDNDRIYTLGYSFDSTLNKYCWNIFSMFNDLDFARTAHGSMENTCQGDIYAQEILLMK